ncbi:hypothetical protein KR009_008986 [Drosophila setifemur]|nr:hypothetical protein KR009_008986 [Drosophila setifemur]
MVLKTNNLTFYHNISEPHHTDASKTLLKQEATVNVYGMPLSHYMEDLLTSTISTNAGKGRQGLEWVIGLINTEVQGIARGTDELIHSTRRSIDEVTESARKSMDEISVQVAKAAKTMQIT